MWFFADILSDPLSGGAGWLGAGLLGLVLAWLLLKHLPEKDRQIKDLIDVHLSAEKEQRSINAATELARAERFHGRIKVADGRIPQGGRRPTCGGREVSIQPQRNQGVKLMWLTIVIVYALVAFVVWFCAVTIGRGEGRPSVPLWQTTCLAIFGRSSWHGRLSSRLTTRGPTGTEPCADPKELSWSASSRPLCRSRWPSR